MIDKTPPTIVNIQYNSNNACTASEVTVSVSATDDHSWISNNWYSWDNQDNRWSTNQKSFDGNLSGLVYVRDYAWNITTWEYNVSWINNNTIDVTPNNTEWLECTVLTWSISINNGICENSNISYTWNILWTTTITTIPKFDYRLMWVWTITWLVNVYDSALGKSAQTNIAYVRTDSMPTLATETYNYSSIISSTNTVNLWNVVTLLWANDWAVYRGRKPEHYRDEKRSL